MSDDRTELKAIQQEIKQLSQKQLGMVEDYQQQVKLYEKQKTLYQKLFGQPPLQPNPKLEAIKVEIQDLKKREENYFKVIQVILNRNI
jgi:hypothetical protein